MPVKKKKKKTITLSVSKTQKIGARTRIKNFSIGGFETNPFLEARKVKTFKDLEKFINENVPAVDAAHLADYAVKYGFDTYNTTMILGNPDAHAAVTRLMKAISNAKGGAQKIYDDCIKNGFKSELGLFCEATGYLVPQTISTFKNNVTAFKDHFGKKRPKKKVPHFKDKEFKI
tara:strand:- start:3830 stop:4351 length:522 start_codon:yes stop_codon:yes gene_type:complete